MQTDERPYPPIGDYGFISDGHSAALVSRRGSIDWCAMPRLDGQSCFGRLLDWKLGGSCEISPSADGWETTRRYLDRTLVLETRFTTDGGEARLLDAFSMRSGGREEPHRQLLRVVEGISGEVELTARIAPRFAFGGIRPWIRDHGSGLATALGGDLGLVIWSDFDLAADGRHDLAGRFRVREGERRRLSIRFQRPHRLYPAKPRPSSAAEVDRRFAASVAWWRRWSQQARLPDLDDDLAAAATTSLPETVGGGRNWDYRYTWVRDSSFALESLVALGFEREAHGFRLFIERTTAGNVDDLQVVYGLGGEHRLTESTLDHLEGYRGSRPVRIGNEAYRQSQLDLFGELVEVAWRSARHGKSPGEEYWELLVRVLDHVAESWSEPDCGIWEIRCEPRHFVHSKVMCWAAFDRALKLADHCGFDVGSGAERWRARRDEIRRAVEERGYRPGLGTFVQAFDGDDLDAALLLLPRVGFVAWDDERMVRTADAVRDRLTGDGGLVRRYRSDDGLAGDEGAFLPCTFWLAEVFVRQGRREEARKLFDLAASCANDLGLFSEEVDPESGELLGNFPQAMTHYAHIGAALALAGADD